MRTIPGVPTGKTTTTTKDAEMFSIFSSANSVMHPSSTLHSLALLALALLALFALASLVLAPLPSLYCV